MPKCDRDMLFDRTARDTELGGDVRMGYAVDPVASEHAHRTFGRSRQRGREAVDPFPPDDRIECGRRVVDRLGTDDRSRRIDIPGVPALATTVRADSVEHDVHADPVQIGEWIGDRSWCLGGARW